MLAFVVEADLGAFLDAAFEDAAERDHALVGVVPAVEDERAQRLVIGLFRRWEIFHDRFQDVVDPDPGFGAAKDGMARVHHADHLVDFLEHAFRVGRWKVDLVDRRKDLEVDVEGHENVGERLRFHALRGIHDQDRAFAGRERPRDFVREIDVARGIDQVQDIGLPVPGFVVESGALGLDRDPALALDVHAVEILGFHLARGNGTGAFKEPIGERGFAVVDVRDDAEVSDVFGHGRRAESSRARTPQARIDFPRVSFHNAACDAPCE